MLTTSNHAADSWRQQLLQQTELGVILSKQQPPGVVLNDDFTVTECSVQQSGGFGGAMKQCWRSLGHNGSKLTRQEQQKSCSGELGVSVWEGCRHAADMHAYLVGKIKDMLLLTSVQFLVVDILSFRFCSVQ